MKNIFLLISVGLGSCVYAQTSGACKQTRKQPASTSGVSHVVANPTPAVLKKHLKSNKTIVIDVYADWCSPCQLMLPIVDAAAQDTDLKDIVFIKIAYDNKELLPLLTKHLADGKTNIPSIPYFFIIKAGKVVDQFTGAMSQETFKKKIKAAVEKPTANA